MSSDAPPTRRGVVYKDLLPIPATTTPAGTTPDTTSRTASPHTMSSSPSPTPSSSSTRAPALHDQTTLSHALATTSHHHEETGIVQRAGAADSEVVNLGWNEPKQAIAAPLVGGLDNEELWLLVRRFNKQIYHVKQYPIRADVPVAGGLDLNIADEEEFSPDKLRANGERAYMTVAIGVLGAVKQVARLRSWRETRRTAWFCTVS